MIRRPDPSLLDLHDALLFDLDGTLVDSDPLHHAAFADLLAEHIERWRSGAPRP